MAYGNALKLNGNQLLLITAADITEYDPMDITSWALIGTLPKVVRIIRVQNLTDAPVYWTFDPNVGPMELMLPNSFILIDVSSNQSENGGLYLANGQPIYTSYITGAEPSTGAVYVSSFYGYNGE